jgi:CBS-domain-containing membrane protein
MSEVGQNAQAVASFNKGVNAIPDAVWAPLAGGVLTLLPGLLGLVTGNVWLFPSLGPTAFLQTANPQHESARPYNTVVGHLAGIVSAVVAVLLFRAGAEPPVFVTHHLFIGQVLASALAVALTLLLHVLLRAEHPPAAATTLLITLGGFKTTPKDLMTIAVGVLLIAVFGELMRRVRLAQPGQK